MAGICNFADDTTFFACVKDLQKVSRLEHDSSSVIEWFGSNYMKLNQDKCHLSIFEWKY